MSDAHRELLSRCEAIGAGTRLETLPDGTVSLAVRIPDEDDETVRLASFFFPDLAELDRNASAALNWLAAAPDAEPQVASARDDLELVGGTCAGCGACLILEGADDDVELLCPSCIGKRARAEKTSLWLALEFVTAELEELQEAVDDGVADRLAAATAQLRRIQDAAEVADEGDA